MKYRVIGWTSFDAADIPEADGSYGADNAIVDHIKANGYEFTGTSHQCCPLGAPVLNDGKKRTYSERAWGMVMADAHSAGGDQDYMKYAFAFYDDFNEKMPPAEQEIKGDEVIADTDISEEACAEVSADGYERAARELTFALPLSRDLRYLDRGDFLKLSAGDASAKYRITSVEEGLNAAVDPDVITPMRLSDLYALICSDEAEKKELGNRIKKANRRVLILTLEPV